MLITQDRKNRTLNLELAGGLESSYSGDCAIGIEELEEQVSAKGGRRHCGRPHEGRNLLKIPAGPRHILRKSDFTSFRIMEEPAMSTTP